MIIQSHPAIPIGELSENWYVDFPSDSTAEIDIRFSREGANPEVVKIASCGASVTSVPARLLDIIQFCEVDYREMQLADAAKPTKHSFQIRSGKYNQTSLINNIVNDVLEIFSKGDIDEDFTKFIKTFYAGRGLAHRDYTEINPQTDYLYIASNSNGTINWEQLYLTFSFLKNSRILEELLLTIQEATTPSHIPSNIIAKARTELFVHAKPKISRRDEANRTWMRDAVNYES